MAKILGNTTSTTLMAEQTYNPKSDKPQSGKAVAEAIAKLLGSAPENLDTLEELAKALDEDENFSATVLAKIAAKADQSFVENLSADIFEQIEQKVDKVEGKGLSTNDFTNAYKEKVDNDTFDGGGDFYEIDCNMSLDEICDRYTEDGLYKILYEPSSDDFDTQTIILSVTSVGVYIDDDYWRQINQCKYDGGVIEVRSRNKDGEWSEWTRVSVTSSDVTKAINKAIGDVETSLENIIKKYGLGGDAQ